MYYRNHVFNTKEMEKKRERQADVKNKIINRLQQPVEQQRNKIKEAGYTKQYTRMRLIGRLVHLKNQEICNFKIITTV